VFDELNIDDEADFLAALVPNAEGKLEAHIHIRYSTLTDLLGRLRVKRWCGPLEEKQLEFRDDG